MPSFLQINIAVACSKNNRIIWNAMLFYISFYVIYNILYFFDCSNRWRREIKALGNLNCVKYEMGVGIVERWHHCSAHQVEELGFRTIISFNILPTADCQNEVVLDCDCVSLRLCIIDSDDGTVVINRVSDSLWVVDDDIFLSSLFSMFGVLDGYGESGY